ncbi:MAG: tRNA pseudouridine(38-40) synthase TruA [Bacteroidetes bacterium]|nr:tRNA pseudouridine(38-40) synthase TruA [Bacteroidota bacterium]
MKNYKLIIQYDGTNYAGWQIQNNAVTIQEKITSAIETLTKEKINLIGSGRTDAGVHAFGQSANFRCENEIDIYKFMYSLNSLLPDDISIDKMEEVDENFHARFDAKKRAYMYFINERKSPFYKRYSYQYGGFKDLSIDYLNEISKPILGVHDFTSLSKKTDEQENKNCEIYNVCWKRTGGFVVFYINASRYLRGMVRTIVGSVLYAAKNNLNENYLTEVINKLDREAAAEAAPAKGLFLFKVKY